MLLLFLILIACLQAKEAAKEYIEAARAYERARDMDSVIRLLLENLNKPEKAAEVVRATRSSEVRMLANSSAWHCVAFLCPNLVALVLLGRPVDCTILFEVF